MTQVYVDRKSNKEPVTYPDEALKESLSETYGVLVYQEQVYEDSPEARWL